MRRPLDEYLDLAYPFNVVADPDGGYVVTFPDLPGCMTVADSADEIGLMAEAARHAWIETAFENGIEIPPPSYPEEYSGKFNVRLPRSLHRRLAEAAERESVSLNTLVIGLLERSFVTVTSDTRLQRIEEQLANLTDQVSTMQASLTYRPGRLPQRSSAHERFRIVEQGDAVENVVAA